MSNLESSNPELHSSCSSPNQDKPNWLTHSKSISAQKIPTQSKLKPLGNQTHKSRKIYKFTHTHTYIYINPKQFGQNLRTQTNLEHIQTQNIKVQIPIVYSRVYYFPQGHVEQSSPPPTFLSPKVLSILSFFAESLLLISSLIRLSMRFSLGSSSILFTLNRTSSTIHRSLLGAKMMSPLRVRIKSCPSWRFSRCPMPTTAADSSSQGSEPTQSFLRWTIRLSHWCRVTNVYDVICLWVCELRRLVEKKAELVSFVVERERERERESRRFFLSWWG